MKDHRKTTVYQLEKACNMDFNTAKHGTLKYKLDSLYKHSPHQVPKSKSEKREEKSPVIVWLLGVEGTRKSFASAVDDSDADFLTQICNGVSAMGGVSS
jgi:hypothetical protein